MLRSSSGPNSARLSEAIVRPSCGAEVIVDLPVIAANYKALKAIAGTTVAAVVKANGYGLGAVEVSETLQACGCEDFFVAHFSEAAFLRNHLRSASRLYVLNGLTKGVETQAAAIDIIPVLNSFEQVQAWGSTARQLGRRLPAILQVDTGMSRLGIDAETVKRLERTPVELAPLDLRYLMTHLACAETPDDRANLQQASRFNEVARCFPLIKTSVANSAAIISGRTPRSDLVRAGIGLFGIDTLQGKLNGLQPAIEIRTRVIQLRRVDAGVGVGYGLSYVTDTPKMLATLAIGYADGWPRSLGKRGAAYFGDLRLPIVGRISMDTCVVDATDIPSGKLAPGDWVELIGSHQSLEQVAEATGSIPHEVLACLGQRVTRRYVTSPVGDTTRH